MNIKIRRGISFQHGSFQNAHVTGERDQFDPAILQHPNELSLRVWLKPCLKMTRRKIRIRDGELARNVEDRRVQNVRDHDTGFRGKTAIANLFQDGSTITAFAGTENPEREPIHAEGIPTRLIRREVE